MVTVSSEDKHSFIYNIPSSRFKSAIVLVALLLLSACSTVVIGDAVKCACDGYDVKYDIINRNDGGQIVVITKGREKDTAVVNALWRNGQCDNYRKRIGLAKFGVR